MLRLDRHQSRRTDPRRTLHAFARRRHQLPDAGGCRRPGAGTRSKQTLVPPEQDVVRELDAVYGPYTGTCHATKQETDIERVAISEARDSGLANRPYSKMGSTPAAWRGALLSRRRRSIAICANAFSRSKSPSISRTSGRSGGRSGAGSCPE